MIRIMPSNDQFKEINFISLWIAQLKNNHLFFDLINIPDVERLVAIHDLEELLEELSH